MNKEVFTGVDRAGRILIFMIKLIGMQRLAPLWDLKLMIEMIPLPYTNIICDKLLYWFNGIIPQSTLLPAQVQDLGKKYDHHCLMEFSEYSEGECDRLLNSLDKFVKSKPEGAVSYHICESATDQERATLYRFVVAPAFRTFAIGKGLQGFSIDFALPKNYTACPTIPEKQYPVAHRWIYSHFGCNVYHEDYTFGSEVDLRGVEEGFQESIQTTGGRAPAEHGHGMEYPAPPDMQERWKKTDPLNIMNPGVGGTSALRMYAPMAVGHGGHH
jgi:D-lactate dehydrogenase